MKIVFDPEACTGHGRCYALAPAVFAADDLGRCEVVVAEPAPEQQEAARIAVASCPEDALTIEE
jgi:ferredoxin